ncbi:MAG: hypothetical protein R3F29_10265 [Planctomycetota bacterium]
MNKLPLPSLLVVLAIAGSARSQLAPVTCAPQAETGDPRIAVHTHETAPGEAPYGIWAAGADYKADFAGGMTFVPVLGRDYPHNQPFAWRTTSVRIGDRELLGERGAAVPTPRWTDYRVEYVHGAVVEAYDVRAEGLEQSFVLAQRPAAAGELCIVGAVASALWAPQVSQLHGDLVFCDDTGAALVRYGRAVAIDADGDVFPMTTDWDGTAITLRLSAEALATADFPLVVDPLLSNQWLLGTTAVAVGWTDAACETANPSCPTAFAYVRHYSATDGDVLVRVAPVTMVNHLSAFADLSVSGSADHPSLAYVRQTNRWVLAYQNLVVATQQMQVRVGTFAGGQPVGVASASVPHVVPLGTHEWRPSAGGVMSAAGGAKALIVWQQDVTGGAFADTASSRVRGAQFDTSSGNGVWNASFLVEGSVNQDAERPSVNRAATGDTSFAWMMVCQVYNNTIAGDDWDLVGRQVSNVNTVSPGQWVSSLGTVHKLAPHVDGRDGRYCVTFSTASTSIGKNTDAVGTTIQCERFDWSDSEVTPPASGDLPAQQLVSNTFRILEPTGIAYNGDTRSHWAIAWRSSSTSPAAYATRVGYRGRALQSPDLIATSGSATVGWPAVYHHDSLAATGVVYEAHGAQLEVHARLFDLSPAAPTSLSAANCATAPLQWNGPAVYANQNQRIGSGLTSVRVFGASSYDLHLMLVAVGTVDVPLVDPLIAAGCSLLVPPSGPEYLGMMPLATGGDVSWPLPLPEHVPATTLHFQDWMLSTYTGLLTATRRLSVPLVK